MPRPLGELGRAVRPWNRHRLVHRTTPGRRCWAPSASGSSSVSPRNLARAARLHGVSVVLPSGREHVRRRHALPPMSGRSLPTSASLGEPSSAIERPTQMNCFHLNALTGRPASPPGAARVRCRPSSRALSTRPTNGAIVRRMRFLGPSDVPSQEHAGRVRGVRHPQTRREKMPTMRGATRARMRTGPKSRRR